MHLGVTRIPNNKIKILSWNIQFLGGRMHRPIQRQSDEINGIARTISQHEADVIIIQEVMEKYTGTPTDPFKKIQGLLWLPINQFLNENSQSIQCFNANVANISSKQDFKEIINELKSSYKEWIDLYHKKTSSLGETNDLSDKKAQIEKCLDQLSQPGTLQKPNLKTSKNTNTGEKEIQKNRVRT
jgi:hypothetical protein